MSWGHVTCLGKLIGFHAFLMLALEIKICSPDYLFFYLLGSNKVVAELSNFSFDFGQVHFFVQAQLALWVLHLEPCESLYCHFSSAGFFKSSAVCARTDHQHLKCLFQGGHVGHIERFPLAPSGHFC